MEDGTPSRMEQGGDLWWAGQSFFQRQLSHQVYAYIIRYDDMTHGVKLYSE